MKFKLYLLLPCFIFIVIADPCISGYYQRGTNQSPESDTKTSRVGEDVGLYFMGGKYYDKKTLKEVDKDKIFRGESSPNIVQTEAKTEEKSKGK